LSSRPLEGGDITLVAAAVAGLLPALDLLAPRAPLGLPALLTSALDGTSPMALSPSSLLLTLAALAQVGRVGRVGDVAGLAWLEPDLLSMG
jgi:hypothetical protein